jgi:hypothetical protein
MEELLGILWILVALLGTRRVFRLIIPKTALHPTAGHYVLAFLLVSFWWWLVGFAFYLFI